MKHLRIRHLLSGLGNDLTPLQVWVKHQGRDDIRIRAGDFVFEVMPVLLPVHNGYSIPPSMIGPFLHGEPVVQVDNKRRIAKPIAVVAVLPNILLETVLDPTTTSSTASTASDSEAVEAVDLSAGHARTSSPSGHELESKEADAPSSQE